MVENCFILCHGSELLAKGGFRRFPFGRNRFRTNYKATFLWDSSAIRPHFCGTAVIEGLDQNQDFFSLLLGNDEIKREVLGIFAEEIYNSLRKA